VDDPVPYEPVSGINSLVTGKNTGKMMNSGSLDRSYLKKALLRWAFSAKFPKHGTGNSENRNREIIFDSREFREFGNSGN
jgi:hypothetical protein